MLKANLKQKVQAHSEIYIKAVLNNANDKLERVNSFQRLCFFEKSPRAFCSFRSA